MARLLLALAGALVLAGCAGGGTETVSVTETRTETETQAVTETVAESVGLPPAVAETHAALLAAARSGDYEEMRPLIPPDGFSYTFGDPVDADPIDYWENVVERSGESPIEMLERILELPYTLSAGTYVWPFAFDKQEDELTRHERRLLGDLAVYSGAGSGYLGWRAGIEPDGTWRFFIAGD
jgi:ABC-type Fe3+-hydroxamate transport system substrate-binding protein